MATNIPDVITVLQQWIGEPATARYVCVTGVHGIMESKRDPGIRKIHNNADLVVPDGMPLVWVGRRRGYQTMRRVYGPDLMLAVLERAADVGWTNYFYGGKEGVAEELRERMVRSYPALKVVGTFCPPFRPLTHDEESGVLEEIGRLRPDLLWVGLSTPKQESLMSHWSACGIASKVMLGVGAAFDFHTGRVPQAPGWMQRNGLEWFFRLCTEPRRLGPRYLRNNPAFLWALVREALRRKRG
jgi:N-acetylglucosaminyldiphosphoundecaprenol N-acetyl-beta-D-mannosaminyltransferase